MPLASNARRRPAPDKQRDSSDEAAGFGGPGRPVSVERRNSLRRQFQVADFHLERGAQAWARQFRRYAARQDGTLRYSEFAAAVRSGELAARHGIAEWADRDLQDLWRSVDQTNSFGGTVDIEDLVTFLCDSSPARSYSPPRRSRSPPPRGVSRSRSPPGNGSKGRSPPVLSRRSPLAEMMVDAKGGEVETAHYEAAEVMKELRTVNVDARLMEVRERERLVEKAARDLRKKEAAMRVDWELQKTKTATREAQLRSPKRANFLTQTRRAAANTTTAKTKADKPPPSWPRANDTAAAYGVRATYPHARPYTADNAAGNSVAGRGLVRDSWKKGKGVHAEVAAEEEEGEEVAEEAELPYEEVQRVVGQLAEDKSALRGRVRQLLGKLATAELDAAEAGEESQGLLVSLAREESLKEAATKQATADRKHVHDLQKQVSDLEARFSSAAEDAGTQREKVVDGSLALKLECEARMRAEGQVGELVQENSDLKWKLEDATQSLAALDERHSGAIEDLTMHKETLASRDSRVATLEREVSVLRAKVAGAEDVSRMEREQREDWENRADLLARAKDEAEAALQKARAQEFQSEAAAEAAREETGWAREESSRATERARLAQEAEHRIASQVRAIEDARDSAVSEVRQCSAGANEMSGKVRQLAERNEALKRELDTRIADAEQRLATEVERRQGVEARATRLEKQLLVMGERGVELETARQAARDLAAELEALLATLGEQRSHSQRVERESRKAQSDADQAERERARMAEELADALRARSLADDATRDFEKQASKAREEAAVARASDAEARRAVLEAERKAQEALTQREKEREQHAGTKNEERYAATQLERAAERIDHLEAQLAAMGVHRREADDEIHVLEDKLFLLQQRYAHELERSLGTRTSPSHAHPGIHQRPSDNQWSPGPSAAAARRRPIRRPGSGPPEPPGVASAARSRLAFEPATPVQWRTAREAASLSPIRARNEGSMYASDLLDGGRRGRTQM